MECIILRLNPVWYMETYVDISDLSDPQLVELNMERPEDVEDWTLYARDFGYTVRFNPHIAFSVAGSVGVDGLNPAYEITKAFFEVDGAIIDVTPE